MKVIIADSKIPIKYNGRFYVIEECIYDDTSEAVLNIRIYPSDKEFEEVLRNHITKNRCIKTCLHFGYRTLED